MVISCAAVNCTNRQGKVDKAEVSFHRFPLNNAGRLAKWKLAVSRANWTPNKYSFLCSKHFAPDCFQQRQEDQQRQLKASAVPSIFDFTPRERVSGRGLRKKVPSTNGAEETEKEEAVSPNRSSPTETAAEKAWVVSDHGEQPSEAIQLGHRSTSTQPPHGGPHQAVGEWSAVGGGGLYPLLLQPHRCPALLQRPLPPAAGQTLQLLQKICCQGFRLPPTLQPSLCVSPRDQTREVRPPADQAADPQAAVTHKSSVSPHASVHEEDEEIPGDRCRSVVRNIAQIGVSADSASGGNTEGCNHNAQGCTKSHKYYVDIGI